MVEKPTIAPEPDVLTTNDGRALALEMDDHVHKSVHAMLRLLSRAEKQAWEHDENVYNPARIDQLIYEVAKANTNGDKYVFTGEETEILVDAAADVHFTSQTFVEDSFNRTLRDSIVRTETAS